MIFEHVRSLMEPVCGTSSLWFVVGGGGIHCSMPRHHRCCGHLASWAAPGDSFCCCLICVAVHAPRIAVSQLACIRGACLTGCGQHGARVHSACVYSLLQTLTFRHTAETWAQPGVQTSRAAPGASGFRVRPLHGMGRLGLTLRAPAELCFALLMHDRSNITLCEATSLLGIAHVRARCLDWSQALGLQAHPAPHPPPTHIHIHGGHQRLDGTGFSNRVH